MAMTGTKQKKFAKTASGRIAYLEAGSGDVAIFIHGVLVNSELFLKQLQGLAGLRRCIALDLMAHGDTEVEPGQDLSFEAQATMLELFIDALGVAKIDLIANDSGVGIAQIFATRCPHRLRSLVLTNGDVHDNWPPKKFSRFLDMVAAGGLSETLQRMVGDKEFFRSPEGLGEAYESPQQVTDATIEAYIRPHLKSSQRTEELERFILAFDNRQTVGIAEALKQITVPTLIVWGTGDIFFNVSWAEWLSRQIPGVRAMVLLRGARLLFPSERADELNRAIKLHWSSCRMTEPVATETTCECGAHGN